MQSIIQLENNNQIILTGADGRTISYDTFMARNPKCQLAFKGKNNRLVLPFDAELMNSKINFMANNGLCYLENTLNKKVILNLSVWENSTFIMGKDCSFNGFLNAIVSENRTVLIGQRVMFSFGIWIRTSDVHIVLSIESRKIINHGKDVIIGDDVWIGQGASLLKGATIGSGTVLGYGSILTKAVPSNCICSGAPAKVVKRQIVWDRQSMHNFSEEEKTDFEETYDFDPKIIYTNEAYPENLQEFRKQLGSIQKRTMLDKMAVIATLFDQPVVIKEKKPSFLASLFE